MHTDLRQREDDDASYEGCVVRDVLFFNGWAVAAPQEEQYRKDDSYPVGTRATAFQQRYLVGTFSNILKSWHRFTRSRHHPMHYS